MEYVAVVFGFDVLTGGAVESFPLPGSALLLQLV
jgi:hypothetical protein